MLSEHSFEVEERRIRVKQRRVGDKMRNAAERSGRWSGTPQPTRLTTLSAAEAGESKRSSRFVPAVQIDDLNCGLSAQAHPAVRLRDKTEEQSQAAGRRNRTQMTLVISGSIL